jgi:hypothetical protein
VYRGGKEASNCVCVCVCVCGNYLQDSKNAVFALHPNGDTANIIHLRIQSFRFQV